MPLDRFLWLANQFEALVERLNVSPSVEERSKLLRRIKILIDEIDQLIFSTSKRIEQDTPSQESSPGDRAN